MDMYGSSLDKRLKQRLPSISPRHSKANRAKLVAAARPEVFILTTKRFSTNITWIFYASLCFTMLQKFQYTCDSIGFSYELVEKKT